MDGTGKRHTCDRIWEKGPLLAQCKFSVRGYSRTDILLLPSRTSKTSNLESVSWCSWRRNHTSSCIHNLLLFVENTGAICIGDETKIGPLLAMSAKQCCYSLHCQLAWGRSQPQSPVHWNTFALLRKRGHTMRVQVRNARRVLTLPFSQMASSHHHHHLRVYRATQGIS